MLTASRNVRPAMNSTPFHADCEFGRPDDVVSAYVIAGQARRFSDDGSLFSFDDYDFGCPLKQKDNISHLIPPSVGLTRSLSWSSFDGGHIFDRYDMHDNEGLTATPATSKTELRTSKGGDSPTMQCSRGQPEQQHTVKSTARRSRRRGPVGSSTCAATKAKSSTKSPIEDDDDELLLELLQERISSKFFDASFDSCPKKSAEGLNQSSHSNSSRQRRGGSTTNFDYLPKAQRESLYKASSLRHMRREGSQRSLVSAASSKAGASKTQPRGRLADSSNTGTTNDRSRARSRSLGAAPARSSRRSMSRRSQGPRAVTRSPPISKDELDSSHSSLGSFHEEAKPRPSPRRRQSPRGEGDLASLWKDLNIPLAPITDGGNKSTKAPRDVPDLGDLWDGMNISLGPNAASTNGGGSPTVTVLSSGSDHQSSRRASYRRPTHRLTSSRRPAAIATVA